MPTTIPTSDLTGAALDWAVATCEGWRNLRMHTYRGVITGQPQRDRALVMDSKNGGWTELFNLNYSTNPAQAWPIIDREMIGVYPSQSVSGMWAARPNHKTHPNQPHMYGPTSLIAAMRCYVASKLGETIEVPEDLLS